MSFGPSGKLLTDALIKKPKAVRKAIDKMLCERSLVDFVQVFWPEIEPANELVLGWSLEAICEHLEAVTDGDIKRLLFNVPPGFMKSLLCNVFWPAWEWGPAKLPSNRFIAASYSQNLTIRDNIKFRNIITCDLYREFWGEEVVPDPSVFTTIKVQNTKTGWKIASSVTGTITGERGDRFVIDDPNAVNEVESDSIRDSTNTWFRETVPTRLNKQDESAIVVVQQRVHEVDVTGTILDLGLPYEHVCIPMEYDSVRHCVTVIGWEDPRGLDNDGQRLEGAALDAADGTLAWPERFSKKAVDSLKTTLGPYAAAGQLQQQPSPRGGGIFKIDWWKQWPPEDWPEEAQQRAKKEFPYFSYVVASLDPALTLDQENDFTALTIWGVWKTPDNVASVRKLSFDQGGFSRITEIESPKIMLLWGWQKRLGLHGPPEHKPDYMTIDQWNSPWSIAKRKENWGIAETVAHDCRMFKVDHLLIENKAGGQHVIRELQGMLSRWDFGITLVDPGRQDKVARAHSVVHLFSGDLVYAPKGKQWCDDIVYQCVVGGTEIITRRGLMRMDEIRPGDEVLTHRGRFRSVLRVSSRMASETVTLEAKSLDPLTLTPEHPIYAARMGRWRAAKGVGWMPAGAAKARKYKTVMRKGRKYEEATEAASDGCTLPLPVVEVPTTEIDLRDWVTMPPQRKFELYSDETSMWHIGARTQHLKWRQPLDHRFGRVCGLYLAEGSSQRGATKWSFNAKTEQHLVQEIQRFADERLGLRSSTSTQSGATTISLCMPLASEFFDGFGKRAHLKCAPEWMWEAPAEFINGLLAGYADGDGHRRRNDRTVECSTVSKSLAWSLRLLALRVGLRPTVSVYSPASPGSIRGRQIKSRRAYYVLRWLIEPGKGIVSVDFDDVVGYSIMKKTENLGEVEVFNMDVMEDNSYCTTGGIVHNCARFPRGKNDDLVDSMTQALQHLRDTRWAIRKDESEDEYEQELTAPIRSRPLYDT